jgi:hypothetical protein
MFEFGKAVSETYFLIFFKNIENTFPKPHHLLPYAKIKNILSFWAFYKRRMDRFRKQNFYIFEKNKKFCFRNRFAEASFRQVIFYLLLWKNVWRGCFIFKEAPQYFGDFSDKKAKN